MQKEIIIKGAREHNLKNITVRMPRDRFIVITGLSGSGKSTLAFDTLYAEGQRRYVESLSAYARQFLGLMNKPDVDSIEGLSPAIAIEQKTTSKNPRSTVGTVTEIYDYLRLLFARVGAPHCPNCEKIIEPQSAQAIAQNVFSTMQGARIQVMAPIIRQKKGTYEHQIDDLHKQGFSRVKVDGAVYDTTENITLDRYKKHDIYAVVDRIKVDADDACKSRIAQAIEQAIDRSQGLVIIENMDAPARERKEKSLEGSMQEGEKLYSTKAACTSCGTSFDELQPRMFSFNSPFGACETCHGLGVEMIFDPELVIPDPGKSIAEGAIAPFRRIEGWRVQQFGSVAKHFGFDMLTPFEKLKKKHQEIILHGSDEDIHFRFHGSSSSYNWENSFEGVIPLLDRLYHQTESESRREELDKYMTTKPCPDCKGSRLKPASLSVRLAGKSIIDVTNFSIKQARSFFDGLQLDEQRMFIAKAVFKEINERLTFIDDVGLGYLTLSRSAGTLSGGEAQRIRLATQIGSNLMGVMYILDEPSIGLHQRDNEKLIGTLHRLRDVGNTLIVVEHDEDTIRRADWVIDIGPGAGLHGGRIIAQGTPDDIIKTKESITGQYLSGYLTIPVPKKRRTPKGRITVHGAREHNLKDIDAHVPTHVLCLITGVSGSGKSTLINNVLYLALIKKIYNSREKAGAHRDVTFTHGIDKVIIIDQSPIGKTPRSNPATYTKVFDDIRALFSSTKEAKMRGYQPGRFSFNVKGGRCEACEGDGLIKIEMNFLPDVYVQCEECKGARYNAETLEVRYKGKTIAQVLDMSVEEALGFFEHIPSLARKLRTLHDVGLSYVKLGQSSTTLSGGEAQRIKLTRELAKRDAGHTVYILDEPTTGLHFEDVRKLLAVLNRLVDKDNSVIVIEHNLDVIKNADWIIDLGPEGGDEGGWIVAEGTPEDIASNNASHTGRFLKRMLA